MLDEQNNKVDEETSSLIDSLETSNDEEKEENKNINTPIKEESKSKFFQKFKIKDIVFLAIMSACTLITGAVMPFLINVHIFGIIQLGLGLQFSVFSTIGMMKVRKPGSLFFQSIFVAVFLVAMFPPMAMICLCGLIAEAISMLIFRGYKSDWACVVSGTLYLPLTLPFLYGYYRFLYKVGEDGRTGMDIFLAGSNPTIITIMTISIVVLCFVGSFVGMLISRELKKAGVLK